MTGLSKNKGAEAPTAPTQTWPCAQYNVHHAWTLRLAPSLTFANYFIIFGHWQYNLSCTVNNL